MSDVWKERLINAAIAAVSAQLALIVIEWLKR